MVVVVVVAADAVLFLLCLLWHFHACDEDGFGHARSRWRKKRSNIILLPVCRTKIKTNPSACHFKP